MPVGDAFDPGPAGQFIHAPRDANGAPCYSDTHSADDVFYPMTGNAPMIRKRYTTRSGAVIRIGAPDVPTVPLDVLRPLLAAWVAEQRAKAGR
jgi:hypothetical protein